MHSSTIFVIGAAALTFGFAGAQQCDPSGSEYDAWSECINNLTPGIVNECDNAACSCSYWRTLSSCWNDYCPESATYYNYGIEVECTATGDADAEATSTANSGTVTPGSSAATPTADNTQAEVTTAASTGAALPALLPTGGVMGAVLMAGALAL